MQIILSSQGVSGAGWGWGWGSSLLLSEILEIRIAIILWLNDTLRIAYNEAGSCELIFLRSGMILIISLLTQRNWVILVFFQTYFDVVAASGSAGSITGPCLGTLPSVRMHFCLCCLSYKWKKLDQMTNTLNHINITLNNPPVEVRWHPVLHSFQQGLLNTLGIQYSHTWLIQQACMIGNS